MLEITRVDTWMTMVDDRVGGLRDALVHLAQAGVNLEFIIGRRTAETADKGVLFVAPIQDDVRGAMMENAGFRRCSSLHSLRVRGPDEPGCAFSIAQALASAKISLRGMSGASMGTEFVMYLAFDTESDASRARECLGHCLV